MLNNPKWNEGITLEPWRQSLLDAADYIERVGWCQGIPINARGNVCISQALNKVTQGDLERWKAFQHLYAYLDTRLLTIWNDGADRTKEEVLTTLRVVARA